MSSSEVEIPPWIPAVNVRSFGINFLVCTSELAPMMKSTFLKKNRRFVKIRSPPHPVTSIGCFGFYGVGLILSPVCNLHLGKNLVSSIMFISHIENFWVRAKFKKIMIFAKSPPPRG